MPTSKAQKELTEIISRMFGHVVSNYRGFDWLSTVDGGRQEIDIWVPRFKLAIEYDGEQHFKPVSFCRSTKEERLEQFIKRQNLDRQKDIRVAASKDIEYFVRFNCYENISYSYVESRLLSIGVSIPYQKFFSIDNALADLCNPNLEI